MNLPKKARGLGIQEQQMLTELVDILEEHRAKNAQKDKYYEGNIPLKEVNLGIALPEEMSGLEIGCAWGAKTVDVLASRSMFDGFVGKKDENLTQLNDIVRNNRLVAEYMKACRDELKLGCTFATLSASDEYGCKIRFH